MDKRIPEHIQNILKENAVKTEAANAIIDTIKPDGYIQFFDEPNKGEYYPVYNSGALMKMFQEGVKYGREHRE